MPPRPLRPCKASGCRATTRHPSGFCDSCRPAAQARIAEALAREARRRGSPASRGYGYRWQVERLEFMRETVLRQKLRGFPCCELCILKDKVTQATIVDHIVPHNGDMVLFWDKANWQCLCKRCHDSKTAREDGGFGNRELSS